MASLHEKIDTVGTQAKMSVDLLKGSIDHRVGAARDHAVHNAQALSLQKQATDVLSTQIASLAGLVSQLQSEVGGVQAQQTSHLQTVQRISTQTGAEIADLRQKVAAMPTANGYLHVGEPFNLPEQPTVKQVAGVYASAPLAMAINGGLLLHDIGYTNQKGHSLTLNPVTRRLEVYTGK